MPCSLHWRRGQGPARDHARDRRIPAAALRALRTAAVVAAAASDGARRKGPASGQSRGSAHGKCEGAPGAGKGGDDQGSSEARRGCCCGSSQGEGEEGGGGGNGGRESCRCRKSVRDRGSREGQQAVSIRRGEWHVWPSEYVGDGICRHQWPRLVPTTYPHPTLRQRPGIRSPLRCHSCLHQFTSRNPS